MGKRQPFRAGRMSTVVQQRDRDPDEGGRGVGRPLRGSRGEAGCRRRIEREPARVGPTPGIGAERDRGGERRERADGDHRAGRAHRVVVGPVGETIQRRGHDPAESHYRRYASTEIKPHGSPRHTFNKRVA